MTGDMAQLIVTCELILGFVGLPAVRVLPVGLDNTCCDAQGRVQGTMTTDNYGKTTWRDPQGRVQGSATTDRYEKTTYRDAHGRVQGSKTVK